MTAVDPVSPPARQWRELWRTETAACYVSGDSLLTFHSDGSQFIDTVSGVDFESALGGRGRSGRGAVPGVQPAAGSSQAAVGAAGNGSGPAAAAASEARTGPVSEPERPRLNPGYEPYKPPKYDDPVTR
jgi:hypothetical protein